jgi:hypothetical protein
MGCAERCCGSGNGWVAFVLVSMFLFPEWHRLEMGIISILDGVGGILHGPALA